jgi:hypothetical protein
LPVELALLVRYSPHFFGNRFADVVPDVMARNAKLLAQIFAPKRKYFWGSPAKEFG